MSTGQASGRQIAEAAIEAATTRRIALNLSELRLRYGWSTVEVAQRAGLSVEDIDRLEADAEPLAIDKLDALAQALDVPVERLLDPKAVRAH